MNGILHTSPEVVTMAMQNRMQNRAGRLMEEADCPPTDPASARHCSMPVSTLLSCQIFASTRHLETSSFNIDSVCENAEGGTLLTSQVVERLLNGRPEESL